MYSQSNLCYEIFGYHYRANNISIESEFGHDSDHSSYSVIYDTVYNKHNDIQENQLVIVCDSTIMYLMQIAIVAII